MKDKIQQGNFLLKKKSDFNISKNWENRFVFNDKNCIGFSFPYVYFFFYKRTIQTTRSLCSLKVYFKFCNMTIDQRVYKEKERSHDFFHISSQTSNTTIFVTF